MTKIVFFLSFFMSITLSAQKSQTIKFAVANGIIGTVNMFDSKKQIISGSTSYKAGQSLPENLKKFKAIAEKGLIEYRIKSGYETLDNTSVEQMNQMEGLSKDNPIFVDGYEFREPETRFYAEILVNIKTKEYNGKKYLDIKTTTN